MTITKLTGGLGNQLFQYAFGKNVSIQNQSELKLDTMSFESNKDRDFKLNLFNIDYKIADNKETEKFIKPNKVARKLFIVIEKIKPLGCKKYYKEKCFNYDNNINNLKSKNLYLEGYWQSEKYFKNIEDTIRKEFTLKEDLDKKYNQLLEKMKNSNSVSIHYRRTDYLLEKNTSIYESLSEDYYQNAIKTIEEKVNNPVYFVFSDDIEWIKKNAKLPSSTIFVSDKNNKDYEEFMLMSKCKHNVIANSSFSWWSAWLNNNPEKIVIAPKNWFVDKNTNTNDLIPDNWIRV